MPDPRYHTMQRVSAQMRKIEAAIFAKLDSLPPEERAEMEAGLFAALDALPTYRIVGPEG